MPWIKAQEAAWARIPASHTPSCSVRGMFYSCLRVVDPSSSDWDGFLPALPQIPFPQIAPYPHHPAAHSSLMVSLCDSFSGVSITSNCLVSMFTCVRPTACLPLMTAQQPVDCKIVVGEIINVFPEFYWNSTTFLPLDRVHMNINEQTWYHLITTCMPKPHSTPSKAESHGVDTDISIPKGVSCRR